MIRLVATDLDGTLLRSDRTINAWTRSVLDACRDAGVLVVPVTARQPVGLAAIADECGFAERAGNAWALCVNGALGVNLVTGETLFEHLLGVDEQRELAAAVLAELPATRFVGVRERGAVFAAQEGYAELAVFTDHHRDPATMGSLTLDAVLGEPNLKLVVRPPELAPVELLRRITALPTRFMEARDMEARAMEAQAFEADAHGADAYGARPFEATISGADFVEVSAAGVTKGSGLAGLCAGLGISADEVVAFGDAHNDISMLRFAGRSFALQGCDEEVAAAAKDGVIGSNDDDAVARTLMEMLRAGEFAPAP